MRPFTDRPVVYVAGPYQHPDPVENSHITIKVADRLADSGLVAPFAPHLSLMWHLVTPRDVDFWYGLDLAYLAKCDALLRIPGASSGADKEIVFAEEHSIPVFYSEDALLTWAQAWLQKSE